MHGTKSHLDLVSTYNERQMCGCSLALWHLTPKNEQHYFPFQFWLLFYAMEIKPLDTHFHFWLNLVNNRFLFFSQHISDPTYAYTNQKSVEVGFLINLSRLGEVLRIWSWKHSLISTVYDFVFWWMLYIWYDTCFLNMCIAERKTWGILSCTFSSPLLPSFHSCCWRSHSKEQTSLQAQWGGHT